MSAAEPAGEHTSSQSQHVRNQFGLQRSHASAEEYAAFLEGHGCSKPTIQDMVWNRNRFVRRYPDIEDWFAAPLAERVGRLHGESQRGASDLLNLDAKPYLCFLAIGGYAWFDWEYLLGVRILMIWERWYGTPVDRDTDRLIDEAARLGYAKKDRNGTLRWVIARLLMHEPALEVDAIDEHQIEEFARAIRDFGERDDVALFFGSVEKYQATSMRYIANLHRLKVVLYHRGQIDAEPKSKRRPRLERLSVRPEMEWVVQRYTRTRALTSRSSTVHKIDVALRRFIVWIAKAHPEIQSFTEVTREHALEFSEWLKDLKSANSGQPIATSTRSRYLSSVSVFFRDTAQWGWEGVPGRALLGPADLPKDIRSVPRFIPEDELGTLMDAIRSLECPYQRAALLVARWSGARADEVRRLEVQCLDSYPDGTARLRIPAGKTYQERLVPIHEEAAEAIRMLQADRRGERGLRDEVTGETVRYLFMHRGKLMSWHYIFGTPLKAACKQAGLTDSEGKAKIWAHRFRHTLGTQMAERGAKLHTIMSVLGHQSTDMTMVYARISDHEVLKDYQSVLGDNATIAGPYSEVLRSGELPTSDVEWIKNNFFKTELELGHCLRLPQEGPCECDLYLSCAKFVTSRDYAPRLRARKEMEYELIEDAANHGWEREVERHQCTVRRIDQLLTELGEPLNGYQEE